MDLHDYSGSGDYLYPSNLIGIEFRLLDRELVDGEDLDFEAHGNWLRVETDEFEDGHITAVGELIEELQRLDAETGEVFEVTRCEKSGPKQTDHYEVNLEEVEPDQSRL